MRLNFCVQVGHDPSSHGIKDQGHGQANAVGLTSIEGSFFLVAVCHFRRTTSSTCRTCARSGVVGRSASPRCATRPSSPVRSCRAAPPSRYALSARSPTAACRAASDTATPTVPQTVYAARVQQFYPILPPPPRFSDNFSPMAESFNEIFISVLYVRIYCALN